jgi:hypothetical protein
MIHRYWFIVNLGMPYGPGNIGVSSYTVALARELIKNEWELIKGLGSRDEIDKWDYIEDIDVRLLDTNHVLPNMGIVIRQGIWWPNLPWVTL